MARIEGICICSTGGCECPTSKTSGWVDAITQKCRSCEVEHGERWGHHSAKVEEGVQSSGERSI